MVPVGLTEEVVLREGLEGKGGHPVSKTAETMVILTKGRQEHLRRPITDSTIEQTGDRFSDREFVHGPHLGEGRRTKGEKEETGVTTSI